MAVTGIVAYENALEPFALRPAGMKINAREDDPLAGTRGEAPKFSGLVVAAERAVFENAAAGAYQGTVIRYPRIYGARKPGPNEWSVIKRVQDGRQQMFVVDGGQEIVMRCAARNAAELMMRVVDQPQIANGQAYNCGDEHQYSTAQWIDMVAEILGTELEIVSLPGEVGAATQAELFPMPGQYSHRLVDIAKARMELGYKDAVSAREATAEYVRWLIAHPPKPGDYAAFIDRFDYAGEDRLLAAYRQAIASIPASAFREVPAREHAHSMPHPKKPALAADHGGR